MREPYQPLRFPLVFFLCLTKQGINRYEKKYHLPGTPWKFNSEFTPEKWWLEDDPFLLEWSIFSGYVKLRGGILHDPKPTLK